MSEPAGERISTALYAGNIRGFRGRGMATAGRVQASHPHIIQINRSDSFISGTFNHRGSVFEDQELLARTLLHEDRHVQQFETGAAPPQSQRERDALQEDADRYVDKHIRPSG
jgi:hypothetical protein